MLAVCVCVHMCVRMTCFLFLQATEIRRWIVQDANAKVGRSIYVNLTTTISLMKILNPITLFIRNHQNLYTSKACEINIWWCDAVTWEKHSLIRGGGR